MSSSACRVTYDQPPRTLGLMAAALTPRRSGSSHAVGCDIPGLGRRPDDVTGHPRRMRRPSRSISSGLDQDGLDTDRGCWLVPNRKRVDRRVCSRLVAWPPALSGLLRGSRDPSGTRSGTRVRPGAWSGTRVRPGGGPGLGSGPGPGSGPGHGPGPGSGPGVVQDPGPVRDPGVVRDPVRASRGVRAPAKASVDDRSRSRLRDRHSSSSRSSDSDDGRRTFQQEGRGRRRRRSPHAASAEHPLATVCNQLLQSMGALRADNATLSERLGALERRGSVADPSPLPLTPHPMEDEDAALEELSLEAPGDSFSEEELPRDWLPRDANGVVRGVVHSPLEAADRVRDDAQKWGPTCLCHPHQSGNIVKITTGCTTRWSYRKRRGYFPTSLCQHRRLRRC